MSTASTNLNEIFPNKKQIILFTKSDLISQNQQLLLQRHFNELNSNFILISSKTKRNIKSIIPNIIKFYPPKFKTLSTIGLIIGYPNLGKSSVINSLRQNETDLKSSKIKMIKLEKGAKVANTPGVTRGISLLKVSSDTKLGQLRPNIVHL